MSMLDTAQLLGNLGAFVGSMAVLATLVYLTVQVRQAKEQISLAGKQARANHARGVLDSIYMSPDLAKIFAKLDFLTQGDYGLDKEETIKFGSWCHAWMQTEQGSFYLLPEGAHDDLHSWWLSTPAGAAFWAANKGIYDPEFVEHMERIRGKLESETRTAPDYMAGADGER